MIDYSLHDYANMMRDARRMTAFSGAIEHAITPDSIVVDLGTGAGIFALLACRFGAKHVYAIDTNPIIHLARTMAHANGFGDQITFFHALSTAITLPERADVLIFDLHGTLPYFQHHLPTLMDARTRFLKPTATLIPQRDCLWAVPVQAADEYERCVGVWQTQGFDLSAAHQLEINRWFRAKKPIERTQFLATPHFLTSLDYPTLDTINLDTGAEWSVSQAGLLHGFSVWFDGELAADLSLSNAPDAAPLTYGNAFFPLPRPTPVQAGDSVALRLKALLIGHDYVWHWQTTIPPQTYFSQSTFHAMLVHPDQLHKKSAAFVPTLTEAGQIDALILDLMRRQHSLYAIATAVAEKFPHHYSSWQVALPHVATLSERYSE